MAQSHRKNYPERNQNRRIPDASLTVGIKRITNYRPFPENDPFRLVLQASHTFKNDLSIHINNTFSFVTQ